jgi:hypothetical protein
MSSRPRRGRPSKGARRKLRLSYSGANSALLYRLCTKHKRFRDDILAAGVIVGLHHAEELPTALFSWSNPGAAPLIPEDLRGLQTTSQPDWVASDTVGTTIPADFHMPAVHDRMLDDLEGHVAGITPGALRSALLWIGLHYVSEFATALAELDDVQRGLAVSQTALAFYSGQLVEGVSADEMVVARHRLRRAEDPAVVARDSGLPVELLTALAAEILGRSVDEGGQLSLAG